VYETFQFEWDEAKRLSNIATHGVDFRTAALIFKGIILEAEDERHDYGEPRFRALGQVGDDVLMVVYTWRGCARRIISAWRVNDEGRIRYQAILAGRP
jgi:uncharacterized DUF497 family protein